MNKIIFLAILSMLMLQACKTTSDSAKPAASTAAPAAAAAEAPKPPEMDAMKIMTNPNIGNCTACHSIPNDPKVVAGDIGPPFIGMKARFPDIAKLRAAVNDQQVISPQTIMPPFGRNKILTPEQIEVVVQQIYKY